MTKDYFRSTAHQGEQALIQIMQKQNRIEYLRDRDAKRPKRQQVKQAKAVKPRIKNYSAHNFMTRVSFIMLDASHNGNHGSVVRTFMGESCIANKS